jgi:hypothetical protein
MDVSAPSKGGRASHNHHFKLPANTRQRIAVCPTINRFPHSTNIKNRTSQETRS